MHLVKVNHRQESEKIVENTSSSTCNHARVVSALKNISRHEYLGGHMTLQQTLPEELGSERHGSADLACKTIP